MHTVRGMHTNLEMSHRTTMLVLSPNPSPHHMPLTSFTTSTLHHPNTQPHTLYIYAPTLTHLTHILTGFLEREREEKR